MVVPSRPHLWEEGWGGGDQLSELDVGCAKLFKQLAKEGRGLDAVARGSQILRRLQNRGSGLEGPDGRTGRAHTDRCLHGLEAQLAGLVGTLKDVCRVWWGTREIAVPTNHTAIRSYGHTPSQMNDIFHFRGNVRGSPCREGASGRKQDLPNTRRTGSGTRLGADVVLDVALTTNPFISRPLPLLTRALWAAVER